MNTGRITSHLLADADPIHGLASLASALAWPSLLVFVIIWFRDELRAILRSLEKFVSAIILVKIAGHEIVLQRKSAEAKPLAPIIVEPVMKVPKNVEMDGFLSRTGIEELVARYLKEAGNPSERFVGSILVYRTAIQRTWFVATNRQLICILDDSDTRADRELIQHLQALDAAQKKIETQPEDRWNGLVHVGEWEDWLYSRALFRSGKELEQHIRKLLVKASSAKPN